MEDITKNSTKDMGLTDPAYWDDYWINRPLPAEIKKSKESEILNIFDRYLPKKSNLSILEIGGAPGQFLVYMHKNFGYKINCLDYSKIGGMITKKNFDLLNIPITVYQEDLFSRDLDLPLFDIVYSLGFIEHFLDLDTVIEKHLELLKPGGILLIGVPNLRGINGWFLKRLSPKLFSKHNLSAMDISNWKNFENKFNLRVLFKGYVGGFEPSVFDKWENKKPIRNKILKGISHSLTCVFRGIFKIFKILRKFNSPHISAYAIGIYKKP